MKTAVGLILALAITTLLISNPPNQSTVNGTTSARRAEVAWRDLITALTADLVTGGYTGLFRELGGGTHVKLAPQTPRLG